MIFEPFYEKVHENNNNLYFTKNYYPSFLILMFNSILELHLYNIELTNFHQLSDIKNLQ
jgi:hypothetical protein